MKIYYTYEPLQCMAKIDFQMHFTITNVENVATKITSALTFDKINFDADCDRKQLY